ncbi:MAG: recombinase family protein [Planctomycetes bacterium]|nr:recombinase family protein [Planctomycetota bacterium]
MTPDQKRAAGKGVVGYVRVSAAGQTDGWSLGSQAQAIRDWAAKHHLPIIAIEQAPDGHESGAIAFDDRVGWQAVERHIATGRVGWIAVSAIDRLSRDLQSLADRVRDWIERDIAVVAPTQGYDHVDGIGPFLLQIWGTLADHERKRLIGRILPGMQARLAGGLPLGTQPLGYQVACDTPVTGQRSRKHLVPDPDTGPIITSLFQQALAQPDWGDRQMAAWAKQQWPSHSWSVGRVAKILANEIYVGVLRSTVQGVETLILDNHPPLVDPTDFTTVQAARRQRAQDRRAGFNAVHAISWLGGIVRCGCCGGTVTWRAFTARELTAARTSGQASDTGRYVCSGGGAAGDGVPTHGCGATWPQGIETFVWRAVERLLEADVHTLHAMAQEAVDTLPSLLDERRRRAQAELERIAVEEVRATDDLASGSLSAEAYARVVDAHAQARQATQALLAETDGLTYLARLIAVQDGSAGGMWRWIPFQAAFITLSMPERRRLLRAMAKRITLVDPAVFATMQEDQAAGRFLGVTVDAWRVDGVASPIAHGMARMLAHHPGWDVGGLPANGLGVMNGSDDEVNSLG